MAFLRHNAWLLLALPPILLWFTAVNSIVPDPYLDEVFHVPQAKQYCDGRFLPWDPKITTPPGLYFISYLLKPVLGCSTTSLRAINLLCTLALAWILQRIYARRLLRRDSTGSQRLATHSALNTVLFPPLFFFSALYYTDISSTLAVALFHNSFTATDRSSLPSHNRRRNIRLVVYGLLALLFRQTNIFWVAIFPAGIVLFRELDRGHAVVKDSMYRQVAGFGDSWNGVARTSWKMEVLYDPPVQNSSLEDYLKCLVSLVTLVLKLPTQPLRLFDLLSAVSPVLIILLNFALFIVLNGGVVLGDKSNHVATLHTPQLLYLWPFFLFFSWPVILPHLFAPPLAILQRFAPQIRRLVPIKSSISASPRIVVLTGFTALALVMVRYNTTIHPFTLADNRHYVFYVFRLLMRPWWMRYLAAPVYVLSAWSCVQALGEPPVQAQDAAAGKDVAAESTASRTTAQGPNVSFLVIWLATTALNLITAPLVEPRYFILPWLFWRLHVPTSAAPTKPQSASGALATKAKSQYDKRLWLETAWFLAVNAVTGYMFLYRGFAWESEKGKVQRFMW
ncbi:glucosyltransferase [Oleoguttula sp. CCFEE 5521]